MLQFVDFVRHYATHDNDNSRQDLWRPTSVSATLSSKWLLFGGGAAGGSHSFEDAKRQFGVACLGLSAELSCSYDKSTNRFT